MSDTTITLRGRVGTDLSKTTTQNGRLTVRFRLAVTNWFATAEGVLTQGRTNWYTIRAWDRLATNLIHSISKGEPIIVVGRPTTGAWIDKTSGELRSELVITAQTVGHDLANGSAHYTKTMRATAPVEHSDPPEAPETGPEGVEAGGDAPEACAPARHDEHASPALGAASDGSALAESEEVGASGGGGNEDEALDDFDEEELDADAGLVGTGSGGGAFGAY